MDHRYGTSSDFSVGLEEELLLVDPTTYELSPRAQQAVTAGRSRSDRVGLEVFASEIELRSLPADKVEDAVIDLARTRSELAREGIALMGSGLHPLGEYGEAELIDEPRYKTVSETMRGLITRTPEAALHIHIGLPDPETAIRVYNGLRSELPLLVGLAANSPWWHGRDSGLASARFSVVRPYPRRGIPPVFDSYPEYLEYTDKIKRAALVEDYTFLWWDIRPHPKLGTIEVREMDSQFSLESIAGLATLVRGLAVSWANRPREIPPAEIIAESCFRASRDGLDATIYDDGEIRPIDQIVGDRLAEVRALLSDLDDDGGVTEIERILEQGNGAARQREANLRGGISNMLRMVTEQTSKVTVSK